MTSLTELAKALKGIGKTELRIDKADPKLIVEALQHEGCRHFSYDDAQIIGVFQVYEVEIDGVTFHLEMNGHRITKEEAKEATYTGLSVAEIRRLKKREV